MSPSTGHTVRASRAGRALAILLLAGAGLPGCAIVSQVSKVSHDVQANRSVIQAFAKGLNSGKVTPFAVTYVTTGDSPTTVTYAVRPPRQVAFLESAGNGATGPGLDLITNASGEYSCSSGAGTGSSGWTCEKLGHATAVAQNQLVGLYTPSHWIAFLTGLSVAAGLAGDPVTSSAMTVNGFALHCVDFRVRHVAGTSTICSTSAGILGYVKVAGNATSFEIKGYQGSPPASMFRLPAGATITNPQSGG